MKTYKENIGETLYHKRTETGLDVYYVPKKGFRKQYAMLASDFGSVDNHFIPIGEEEFLKVPDGIAHFLEHKIFEEPEESVFEKFSELGTDVNAYTNFNQTAYLFTSTNNFYESLETLIKFVQNPHFTDENVEKEKGIIEQEIRMYDDDPNWTGYFNCLDAMYHNHPVKIDVAGTVETIQDIDKELLYRTYNTFYHPENMTLFIVGDLSFDKIIEVVNKYERNDFERLSKIEKFIVEEPKEVREKYVEKNMMTSTPMFFMGYKDNDIGHIGAEEVKKDLITNIILDMLLGESSVFYNELYDEGLIDSSFGAYFSGKIDYGYSMIVGEVEDPRLVSNRIIEYFDKPAEEILKEEDFNRIKNDEIGSFLMGLDSIEFIANTSLDMELSGFSSFEYLDLLEGIKFSEVMNRFKEHFNKDRIVLSVINPIKEG